MIFMTIGITCTIIYFYRKRKYEREHEERKALFKKKMEIGDYSWNR